MRYPPRIVDTGLTTKAEPVLLGGLSRICVNHIVSSRDRLEQGSSVSEKVGRPFESRYERGKFIVRHCTPNIRARCAMCMSQVEFKGRRTEQQRYAKTVF
jgi:hypothetical protein